MSITESAYYLSDVKVIDVLGNETSEIGAHEIIAPETTAASVEPSTSETITEQDRLVHRPNRLSHSRRNQPRGKKLICPTMSDVLYLF